MATTTAKPITLTVESEVLQHKPHTLWGDVWRQYRKHKLAMGASVVLLLLVLGVFTGDLLWRLDPEYIEIMDASSGMTAKHPFGTDNLGRDTLARVIHGGRVSLLVGVTAMAIAMTVGTTIGLLAGYFKALDNLLMRLTDLFLSLPSLPLLLVVTLLFREPLISFLTHLLSNDFMKSNNILQSISPTEVGIFIMIVSIIGLLGWMPTARLVRGEVLTIKEREFVLAARSLGSSHSAIIRRHILPNVLSPVIVAATFSIGGAIITESALSFLGLGFPPDFPTWGRLLFDGKDSATLTPDLVFWPGLAIALTVLCVNFVGDGLRDALDPRLRK